MIIVTAESNTCLWWRVSTSIKHIFCEQQWWKDSWTSWKYNDELWLGAIHCPPLIFKISYWLFLLVLALKYLPPMSYDWWETILNPTIGHWPEFDKLIRIKWKLKRLMNQIELSPCYSLVGKKQSIERKCFKSQLNYIKVSVTMMLQSVFAFHCLNKQSHY